MSSWNEFLQTAGAKQDQRFGRHFSSLAQEAAGISGTALVDAGHLGVISITGPEAESFLQGQLTCDVKEVNAASFRLGAWCSAKGRVQTSFWLAQAWDQYLLIMDASLIEPIQAALKKYILFSKAKMEVRTELVVLGWLGDAAKLESVLGLASPDTQSASSNESACVLNLGDRLLILSTRASAEQIWELDVPKLGNNAWKLLDIRAGVGLLELAGKELFLPQNLNFDLIGGVNFKKGCYIGQEIVARLHWKGQAKNRALHFVSSNLDINAGETVHTESGRALGEIISCAVNENNELEILLNARLDSVQDSLTIPTNPTTILRLLTLPYAIPSTEASHSTG